MQSEQTHQLVPVTHHLTDAALINDRIEEVRWSSNSAQKTHLLFGELTVADP